MEPVNRKDFASIIAGAVAVFAPLSGSWTLAIGVLALGLGAAAMIEVLQPKVQS